MRTGIFNMATLNFRLASRRGDESVHAAFIVQSTTQRDAADAAQLLVDVLEATTGVACEIDELEGSPLAVSSEVRSFSRVVPGEMPAEHFVGAPFYSPLVEYLARPNVGGCVSVAHVPSRASSDLVCFAEHGPSAVLASLAALELSGGDDSALAIETAVTNDAKSFAAALCAPTTGMVAASAVADLMSVTSRVRSKARIKGTTPRQDSGDQELLDLYLGGE